MKAPAAPAHGAGFVVKRVALAADRTRVSYPTGPGSFGDFFARDSAAPVAPPYPFAPPAVPAFRARAPKRSALRVLVGAAVAIVCVAVSFLIRAELSGRDVIGAGDGFLRSESQAPPLRDVIAPQRILPAVAAPAGSGGFTSLLQRHGRAVTWDPCQAIHYVVRPDNEIPGGRLLLQSAIAGVGAATGLDFIDDGVTEEAPSEQRAGYQPNRYPGGWAPVLIAWSSPTEDADLSGDVVGLGGPIYTTAGGVGTRNVSGQVTFDAAQLDPLLSLPDGQTLVRDVMLHEFGHLVGLGHVNDTSEIMNPQLTRPLVSYGAGDLRGLAMLGAGRCYPKA